MAEAPKDLPERVAVLETQTKGLVKDFDGLSRHVHDKLEPRMRALEGKGWWLIGGLVVFVALAQEAFRMWVKGAA